MELKPFLVAIVGFLYFLAVSVAFPCFSCKSFSFSSVSYLNLVSLDLISSFSPSALYYLRNLKLCSLTFCLICPTNWRSKLCFSSSTRFLWLRKGLIESKGWLAVFSFLSLSYFLISDYWNWVAAYSQLTFI